MSKSLRVMAVIVTVTVIVTSAAAASRRAAGPKRGSPIASPHRARDGSAETDGLHVIPFPGTPDASPSSQIIFSSLAPSDLGSVSVDGSLSGLHTGHLTVLPDGAGTAFVPDRPFADSEQVSVTADLTSPAAGTAAGAPGATAINFGFRTATPGSEVALAAAAGEPGNPSRPPAGAPAGGPAAMSFHSEGFHPAAVRVAGNDHSPGDIFLAPRGDVLHFDRGPEIVDGHGHLVWFRNLGNEEANNLAVQHYHGRPVLAWWQGTSKGGHAEEVILDRAYHTVAIVKAAHGYLLDTHTFEITPQGTALGAAVVPVKMDLTPEGGPRDGTLDDCVIQELDIKTGKLLWEWHSLGHIPISASYTSPTPGKPFDYFHMNSVQQLPGGDLLVSARATWTVYRISKRTGRVVWRLGGKHSNFNVGPQARFEWQHNAHLIDHNLLSVFDNAWAGGAPNEPQSSGKVMRVNFRTRTVTLVHQYTHRPPLLSVSQGNVQTLPNWNRFVGWGDLPEFSEYTAGGRQIFTGRLARGQSYRAYLSLWGGRPTAPPVMANLPGRGGTVTVYASWNGATNVSSWRVLGGSTPKTLTALSLRKRKTGFETAITVHRRPAYLAVQALDAKGRVLGTSRAHLDSHPAAS